MNKTKKEKEEINNLRNEIAEIIRCEFEHHHKGDLYHIGHITEQILALPFEGYEVEEECVDHVEPSQNTYARFVCANCSGTGKIRRPATLKDFAEGKEIKSRK